MNVSFRWLPNAICIVRILLVGPIVLALLRREFGLALFLIGVAGMSDGLDGYLAKRFDWRTRLGGLLDPAADKLLLVSVFITLTVTGYVPVGVMGIAVGRDILIIGGAVAYQFLIGALEGEPTSVSKLNTACQLGFVVFTITNAALAWVAAAAHFLDGARSGRRLHEPGERPRLRAGLEPARVAAAARRSVRL